MTPVDDALQCVLQAVPALGCESLPLAAARGRVLAAGCVSQHPLPLFTQSAVDGYAVRAAELANAPLTLPLGAAIAAQGQRQQPVLAPGTAMRILTGGVLPLGADTVVRQELTEKTSDGIRVLRAVASGTDIRAQGEECAAGSTVAEASQPLTPGLIAALALAGIGTVTVARLPRVIVLVTGDEVVASGSPLQLGQVPDANGPLLLAFLSQWGVPPLRVEPVADTAAAVQSALARAVAEADLVITTGGVSVGDHDYIPSVSQALGGETLLWKVAQKPGMPLFVARHGAALLFGLPGNPASVLVNLLVYVRAALDALQGLNPAARWQPVAALPGAVPDAQKTLWLRAVREPLGSLRLLRGQASHMLTNLAEANALVRLPPASEAGRTPVWAAIE